MEAKYALQISGVVAVILMNLTVGPPIIYQHQESFYFQTVKPLLTKQHSFCKF